MPLDSRSLFFLPPPNKDEKMPSFSFLTSPPLLRLLSFFLSSESLWSMLSRSNNKLSRPRCTAVSMECCKTSRRAVSWALSRTARVLPFLTSSSFRLSFFSFSSLPLNQPQLDFLGPELSTSSFFDFFSTFFSSVKVGMKVKLSVLPLPLPGSGEGWCAISVSVCAAETFGIACDVEEACRPRTGLLLDRGGGSSRGTGC